MKGPVSSLNIGLCNYKNNYNHVNSCVWRMRSVHVFRHSVCFAVGQSLCFIPLLLKHGSLDQVVWNCFEYADSH